VEKNIGNVGIIAVNAPTFVAPNDIAATCSKLASVQFKESIPWLKSQHVDKHIPNDDILE
jgi:hypothetical protein